MMSTRPLVIRVAPHWTVWLLPEIYPLLHAGPRCHCGRDLIFDETTQANLVLTGHLNKFYTKTTPLTPTNLGQSNPERRRDIRHKHSHLKIGTGLYGLSAGDGAAWDR